MSMMEYSRSIQAREITNLLLEQIAQNEVILRHLAALSGEDHPVKTAVRDRH